MRIKIFNFGNFLYFHRRRLIFNTSALIAYSTVCYKARNWDSEIIRMGIAGSMAHGTVEALFHFVDTVNIKSKASTNTIDN